MENNHEIVKDDANFWYKIFVKLPAYIFWITSLLSLFAGIILLIIFKSEVLWLFFVLLFGGVIIGSINFCILKIFFSPTILNVEFLRKLCGENTESTENTTAKQEQRIKNYKDFEIVLDDDIEVAKEDECPCCFNKINPNDTVCSYCGYKLK